jgi:hypothetical protein
MAYNNLLSRTDVAALSAEVVSEIMLGSSLGRSPSVVLEMSRRIPLANKQVRLPVLSVLPTPTGSTATRVSKQTTEANWENKYLNVEEIAAIARSSRNVIDDADMDIDALLSR